MASKKVVAVAMKAQARKMERESEKLAKDIEAIHISIGLFEPRKKSKEAQDGTT